MPVPQRSPLAALTAAEIEFATGAFTAAARASSLVFYEVSLHEPFTTSQKAAAMSARSEAALSAALPARRAKIVACEPSQRRVLEGDAPLDAASSRTVFVRELSRTQPPMTAEEYALCERLVIEYAPFRSACEARGLNSHSP